MHCVSMQQCVRPALLIRVCFQGHDCAVCVHSNACCLHCLRCSPVHRLLLLVLLTCALIAAAQWQMWTCAPACLHGHRLHLCQQAFKSPWTPL